MALYKLPKEVIPKIWFITYAITLLSDWNRPYLT